MTADAWLRSGLQEVFLPSGWWVRGVLPDLASLARRDLLPSHLLEVAVKGADPEWLGEPEHSEERTRQAREYLGIVIAAFPREARPSEGDGWDTVTMTPADLETMDVRDVDLLEDLVLRLRTPEEVTTRSRILRGELPAEVAEPGDADFRGQRGGDADREDGEPVGDATERAAGDQGPGGGLPDGRGAGDAPDDRGAAGHAEG